LYSGGSEEFAFSLFSGRVPDLSCCPAEEGDARVACVDEALEGDEGEKVTDVEVWAGRIYADVDCDWRLERGLETLQVCAVGEEVSGLEIF
jgi:hypothetical protein